MYCQPSGEGVEVFQFSIVLLSFIYESRRMSRNNYDTPKIYLGVLIAKAWYFAFYRFPPLKSDSSSFNFTVTLSLILLSRFLNNS